jgi:membrane fusion protein, heavy metal efflux system
MKRCIGVPLLFFCTLEMGCRSTPAAGDAADKNDAAQPVIEEISVDVQLLRSGRIATARVSDSESGAEIRLPAEVVPAPSGEAEVGALVSGRLAELLRHEGDKVKKGDILAWIDAPDVGMARADLLRVQAETDLAEKRLVRARKLAEEHAIADSALEEAEASVGATKAQKNAILARLDALGASFGAGSKVAVRAPIEGEIVDRHVTIGSAVDAGRPLMRIISKTGLRVRTQFPAALSPLPSGGEMVTLVPRVTSAPKSEPCKAAVVQISAALEPSSRTLTLYLSPGPNCDFLRPFEPVEAVFLRNVPEGSAKSLDRAITIPRDALIDIRGVPTVFVALQEPGKFRAQTVNVEATLGSTALLRGGVRAGDEVVVRGVLLLKGEVMKETLGGD